MREPLPREPGKAWATVGGIISAAMTGAALHSAAGAFAHGNPQPGQGLIGNEAIRASAEGRIRAQKARYGAVRLPRPMIPAAGRLARCGAARLAAQTARR